MTEFTEQQRAAQQGILDELVGRAIDAEVATHGIFFLGSGDISRLFEVHGLEVNPTTREFLTLRLGGLAQRSEAFMNLTPQDLGNMARGLHRWVNAASLLTDEQIARTLERQGFTKRELM